MWHFWRRRRPKIFFEVENFNKNVIFDTLIQIFTLSNPGPGRIFYGTGTGIRNSTGTENGTGIEIPVDPCQVLLRPGSGSVTVTVPELHLVPVPICWFRYRCFLVPVDPWTQDAALTGSGWPACAGIGWALFEHRDQAKLTGGTKLTKWILIMSVCTYFPGFSR